MGNPGVNGDLHATRRKSVGRRWMKRSLSRCVDDSDALSTRSGRSMGLCRTSLGASAKNRPEAADLAVEDAPDASDTASDARL